MNSPSIAAAPRAAAAPGDSSIGGILLSTGKITPENAERVLRMQKELGIRFGEAAQRLGLITEADIQQVLARQFDYPYLQTGERKYSDRLLAAYQPFSPQVEQLRAVRSQLMLRWFARGRKALAIVEVGADDGASLFAANLAVVFSQLGEHTLLVDANLRQPSQHSVFDLPLGPGLSDLLAGRADRQAIAKIDSFVALSLLTAGTLPPNPQELLSRAPFVALNGELEAAYDVVLYNAAPFALGADALAVAARAGGVLLVARKNATLLSDITALTDEIRHSGAEVVGAVMVDY
ncbi:chain length determinant protein tyrosine kinase EpsG [Rugamonas sp. DEMB1]|jgi:protein-tyrosine kinase|uniref:chain length determinant protein tyrosine kinase EpsG n=1 Tax=Rugamonas sp. DEMB1 TaxID=3039386 RepID=UPI00244AADEC|nr:chain length determinant protein tyrosine kinase EpsG [Rugamonas sp. DEMB1]WGG49145.1 chain length determinant protein tyrosine kinase EpsG [Rugamonas sp. DEMB1]